MHRWLKLCPNFKGIILSVPWSYQEQTYYRDAHTMKVHAYDIDTLNSQSMCYYNNIIQYTWHNSTYGLSYSLGKLWTLQCLYKS